MSNVGEMDRVWRFLTDHPALHDQTVHECGTAGCVAGWTVALERGVKPGEDLAGADSLWMNIGPRARQILGLTDPEAWALFYDTIDDRDEVRTSNAKALSLMAALIARDKGCPDAGDLAVLDRYGLPTEPAGGTP